MNANANYRRRDDELDEDEETEFRASIDKLSRDLTRAAVTLSEQEARFLVDCYYVIQEGRKRLGNQMAAMNREPHEIIAWQKTQAKTLEGQIKRALEVYSNDKLIGRWLLAHYGIGPVIAAGLMAHIDIKKAVTAGHLWSFGGYNPEQKWEKGQKRPWNAGLKTLYWKIGQSFMKFSGRPQCPYGHQVYAQRKAFEIARNEAGANRERAAHILSEKNFRKDTEAYKAYSAGKLPPAHIDAQARRYAVKLFLSHLQCVWWYIDTGKLPPDPYAIGQLDHAHFIPPQHTELVEGLPAALRKAGRGRR